MATYKTRALTIYVYRDSLDDCTNEGVSSKYDELLVECPDGNWEVDNTDPRLVRLEKNAFNTCILAPVNPGKTGIRMMGGNYAAASDSRFSRMIERLLGHRFYGAVPIHDRFETQQEYEALSR